MFRQVGSVFSFLTILPASSSDIQTVAKYMYLFPIIGIAIGAMIGTAGWGLSIFLEPLIVGLLLTAALLVITGIHHTDGLSDFADGLMAKGTKQRKLEVMRDPAVGSAGVVAIVMCVVGMVIALSMMKGFDLFYAILMSEIIAKFSMVLAASIGPSAWAGSNSSFIDSMKDKRRLGVAAAITMSVIMIFQNNMGLVAFAAGVILTLVIVGMSRKIFGGISGDVMGAINEITRLSSLFVFVLV